jgi:hypothetical protein
MKESANSKIYTALTLRNGSVFFPPFYSRISYNSHNTERLFRQFSITRVVVVAQGVRCSL